MIYFSEKFFYKIGVYLFIRKTDALSRIASRKVSASIVEISLKLSKWVVLSVHSHDSQFYYGSHTGIARRRNGRIGRSDTVQSPWIRGHAGSDGKERKSHGSGIVFGKWKRQVSTFGDGKRLPPSEIDSRNRDAEKRMRPRRASWPRRACNRYGRKCFGFEGIYVSLSLCLTSVIPSGKPSSRDGRVPGTTLNKFRIYSWSI